MLNKAQFLTALRARLIGLPREDLERTLQYYSEMIDDRVEEGMTEFEATADVGDPAELAAMIRQKPVRRAPVREHASMSVRKRAVLIVCAAALICAGVLVILGTMNLSGGSDSMKEYTFASADIIRALEIESGAAEVKLLPASDGICRVRCAESPTLKYRVVLDEERCVWSDSANGRSSRSRCGRTSWSSACRRGIMSRSGSNPPAAASPSRGTSASASRSSPPPAAVSALPRRGRRR